MSSDAPSKKDALGLYIRDTAKKLQNTAEILRTVILGLMVVQGIMFLFAISEILPMVKFGGIKMLLPLLMMPVGFVCAYLFVNFMRYSSDMLVLVSLKLVESEITEEDVAMLPAIPAQKNGASPDPARKQHLDEENEPQQDL